MATKLFQQAHAKAVRAYDREQARLRAEEARLTIAQIREIKRWEKERASNEAFMTKHITPVLNKLVAIHDTAQQAVFTVHTSAGTKEQRTVLERVLDADRCPETLELFRKNGKLYTSTHGKKPRTLKQTMADIVNWAMKHEPQLIKKMKM